MEFQGSLVSRALQWSAYLHRDQVRKYTGEPYVCHTAEVVSILASFGIVDEVMLAAGALHDGPEDTLATKEDIYAFHYGVGEIVDDLTEREYVGNRVVRKSLEAKRLHGIRPQSQTVKYADLVSNTRSIVKGDPKFAKIYLPEKKAILEGMNKGHPVLYQAAWEMVETQMRLLGI